MSNRKRQPGQPVGPAELVAPLDGFHGVFKPYDAQADRIGIQMGPPLSNASEEITRPRTVTFTADDSQFLNEKLRSLQVAHVYVPGAGFHARQLLPHRRQRLFGCHVTCVWRHPGIMVAKEHMTRL